MLADKEQHVTIHSMAFQPKCEAAVHHPDCDGLADSFDHFTPRCFYKIFGNWVKEDPSNRIPMNRLCHTIKDRTTSAKLCQLQQQFRGKFIGLGEHV